MKKLTSEALVAATQLRKEGKNQREIMESLGLNLSQVERHFWAVDIANYGGFIAQPDSLTAKAAIIADLRLKGQSWGLISVRFREPESRTRKHFKEASGMDSKGMRIGKGGRYVDDDVRFYTGSDRAKLGTELDAKVAIAAQVPDPDATPKRVLPKVAQGAAIKKARKPRTPKAPAPKALTA